MNFEFTDDQRAIKRTAHDFLAARYKLEHVRELAASDEGFADAEWAQIAELGWPGIAIAEEDGGHGLGLIELALIAERTGYATTADVTGDGSRVVGYAGMLFV